MRQLFYFFVQEFFIFVYGFFLFLDAGDVVVWVFGYCFLFTVLVGQNIGSINRVESEEEKGIVLFSMVLRCKSLVFGVYGVGYIGFGLVIVFYGLNI